MASVRARRVAVVFSLVALVGVVLGVLAWRCAPAAQPASISEPAPPEDEPAELEVRALLGEVVSARDGAALAGVEVRALLDGGAVATAVTDDDGGFSLEGLRAAITLLRFKRAGYLDAEIDGAALPKEREAFWTQQLTATGAAVEPETGTAIEVVVVDEGRTPVSSYVVTLVRRIPEGPHLRAAPRSIDVSDPGGRALLPATPGPYWLSVSAEGFRPAERTTVDVTEGQTAQVRVVVARSNAVRGTVKDADTGRPVSGAEVRVAGVRDVASVFTDAEGRFSLRSVVAEDLSLAVRAPGYLDLDVGGIAGARSRDEVIDLSLTPARAGLVAEVVGIGVHVEPHKEGVLVRGVIAEGPAAGKLDAGDLILEADQTPFGPLKMRERIALIRGAEGTEVELAVRKKNGAIRRVTVERARVGVPEL